MYIKNIEYKNFLSIGNHPIKLDINKSHTTLIGGRNGSGKSAALGALVYCLYGKMLNNLKLEQIINSTNKKNLLTIVEFEKNGEEWKVVRGEKPKKFEIYRNNEKIDQYAKALDQQKFLEVIMGMDFRIFTQLVAINKERYIPFMEMTPAERRKVVEDVLGIGVFSYMNDVTKEQHKIIEKELSNFEFDIKSKNVELNATQTIIDNIQNSIKLSTDKLEQDLADCEQRIKEYEDEIKSITEESTKLIYEDQLKQTKKQLDEFSTISNDFERELRNYSKEIKFFEENDNCPTCDQEIDSALKDSKIANYKLRIKEINDAAVELVEELETVVAEKGELETIKKKYEDIIYKIKELTIHKNSEVTNKQKIEKDIKETKNSLDLRNLEEKQDLYNDIQKEIEAIKVNYDQLTEQSELYDLMKGLLKDDGVKSLIVKDYNVIMNKKINEYLHSMGFYISMTVDENFNEKFHSMNKESFSYNNLSTGQKTRLNLAITLALLEVAAVKNSAVCNVLWCDELLENLDTEGVSDVVRLFKEKLTDKNIFVVSQRYDEFLDKFDDSIRFRLVEDFTEITK